MINGDELVAELCADTKDSIVLKNPMVVEESTTTGGLSNIVLTSYLPFAKSEPIEFSKFHVINISPVTTNVERFYKNSLIYNIKYIGPNIEKNLEAVNKNMEEALDKASRASVSASEDIEGNYSDSIETHRVVSTRIH